MRRERVRGRRQDQGEDLGEEEENRGGILVVAVDP